MTNNQFHAFDSPNLPPLATFGVDVDVSELILQQRGENENISCKNIVTDPVVLSTRIYPGISALAFSFSDSVKGVVVETYGSGTFPTQDHELLDSLAALVQKGVVVVNCSQCYRGRVKQELYGTSRSLAMIGVTSAHDMTPEATLTKLYVLLAQGYEPDEVRKRMEMNLAGEIRVK